jgi:hypothetical protein
LTIPEVHFEQAINIHQLQPQGRRLERPYSPPPRHRAKTVTVRFVETIEGWTAIKYKDSVQWIDELLAEKEKSEDDE